MNMRLLGPLAALLLLPGCGDAPASDQVHSDGNALPAPEPALWEITGEDGNLEGWLFGTIHALPDGVNWRTEKLDQALRRSEALVVEIADLDDQQAIARTFYQLALTPDQPVLQDRVSPDRRRKLAALMEQGGFDKGEFQSTETWAAAITFAQLASVGDSENGVDRALIRGFGGGPVIELEGARKQLGIFDRLPEKEQIDLLHAVIDEGAVAQRDDPRKLMVTWLTGNLEQLELENGAGMLADPELREALLVKRNTLWVRRLRELFAGTGPLMIAVGAAHMTGPDGLPALLGERGYGVTRIQ
ncbi:TraB/GumN family protein [Pontixanthobacter sp.]|uniref:TraB/GumN family protein n=1 Tax=Pontixanthobacter sp. TaxID=2792078 RepID=UPI003C7C318D